MIDVHGLDRILAASQPFVFATAAVFWIVAVVTIMRHRRTANFSLHTTREKVFIACIAVFAGSIFGDAYLIRFIEAEARTEIRPLLTSSVVSVSVGEKKLTDYTQLVSDLRNMYLSKGHHSHPVQNFKVTLQTEKGDLVLNLARDSSNPDEYWVFYPGFGMTHRNEIGRVVTAALNGL